MGTSKSSNGPSSGVSFDPPWLENINLPNPELTPVDDQKTTEQKPEDSKTKTLAPLSMAPPARFRGARTNIGNYARTGNKDSLRHALGNYSKTGMGGAKNVSSRMRVSTSVGSNLFNALESFRNGSNQTLSDLFTKLKSNGADAYQFIDAIVENVCPNGGSLDEVSCQNSVFSALSEFFDKNPDTDISNLSDDNLWSLTASFLGHEAFSRVQLDIGQSFESEQISLSERMTRLNDMREYIEAEISTQLNILRIKEGNQSSESLKNILKIAIENTFLVFEVEV